MTRVRIGVIRCAAIWATLSVAISIAQERAKDAWGGVGAQLAAGLFERAEATARAELERARAAYADDSLEVTRAADELVRTLLENGRGTDDQTLTLARKTLRSKETRLGSDHPDIVSSLINLGDTLVAAASFDEAIAALSRAVAIRQKSSDPTRLDLADALDHLGSAFSGASRYEEALKALDQGLRLKERTLDPSAVSIARTLEETGFALQSMGAYERAGVAVRRAVAIQEAASTQHPAYARTLNLLAQQLWFEGELVESRNVSESAVAVAERTLRPDHPTVALSLRYLAATVADLGDLERSVVLRTRALAIAERTYGAAHHLTAEYLHPLASAELRRGEYATARRDFQRVLSILETRYGAWHRNVATTLSRLALADLYLGDYANAQRELSRAVAIHERAGGPNHPYVANMLMELAPVYREQGFPAQAAALLRRALTIREKALGPNHRDVARTLAELAATLSLTGQLSQAQAAATRALGILERLQTPDAPDYATVLALYAELQARRGDAPTARDYYARAMAIREKVFGIANPSYADTQAGFARALAKLGDMPAALAAALSAEAAGRDHLRTMLRSLPERQSLNYAAVRPKGLDLILSMTLSEPTAARSALDGVIRSRALVLDEIAARRGARTASANADPASAAFLSAQQRLANLLVRGPGPMTPDAYKKLVDAARRDSERAEQALAAASVEFRSERTRAQIGLDEVAAALPEESALVSFVRYQRTVLNDAAASARQIPSYAALILTANQPPTVVALGAVQSLDALVSQWRTDIAAEASVDGNVPASGSVLASRASGLAVRQRAWDRLTPHIGQARQVFVVPDGALSLVPFAALPIGQRSYVLERGPVIHYLSAERDLVPQPGVRTNERGLLAVGGPAFDDGGVFRSSAKAASASPSLRGGRAAVCGGLQAITFQPLTGTLEEVRDVSRVWKTTAGARAGGSSLLVGRDASEARFKRDAPGSRVLHLATHGFFVDNTCSSVTGPATPAGSRGVGGLARANAPVAAENPLLLSGLALAGANRRGAAGPDEDDGILTAEEVAALNLQGVEWAVLSACDTGIGEIRAGEGVFGLRRAFQVAGAQTVIMSLWSVDDQATRAWMRALYENRFQRQLSTADALHAAALSVLRARRAGGLSDSPFYWAAFVAVGDWR